jgi:hypothetical protein
MDEAQYRGEMVSKLQGIEAVLRSIPDALQNVRRTLGRTDIDDMSKQARERQRDQQRDQQQDELIAAQQEQSEAIVKANSIAADANRIAQRSQLVSVIMVLIALGSLVFTAISSNRLASQVAALRERVDFLEGSASNMQNGSDNEQIDAKGSLTD